jgi:superfamily II DNA or RNA helicase
MESYPRKDEMAETVLKVDNIIGRLLTTDQKLKDLLSEKLRFRPKNYFHNPRYQSKKWDGWKYFFDKKTGAFLTGILPEIQAALRFKKKEYTLVDSREVPVWTQESIGTDFLKGSFPDGVDEFDLHDFQPDLLNQAIKYGRGIIKAPTGAGKTLVLISTLKCLPPKTPTLFLTKNKGLVHQNWKEMKLWGIPDLGRWYGGYKEPNYVTCATIHKDTFESLDKLLPKFKAIIVDEVHECMSAVPLRAYKKMKNAIYRLGISATPFKYNKKKIDECHKWTVKGHFGPVFKTTTTDTGELTTADLQDRGILAKSDCYFYPIDRPQIIHEPYMDAVKLGIEQNFHFHETVARLAKSCPGRTLIVVSRIEQGEYLKSLIPGSQFIQGDTKLKDREPILEAMLKGDRSVGIVMQQIITAGINIKIHDLINAAGGDAAHNVIQLMGRGLRPANDKDLLRYHDFLFTINDYLRKHSMWRMEVIQSEGHSLTLKDNLDF